METYRVATGNLVQGGDRVAANVTVGIAQVFQEHMTVLADCRYKPPEAELTAVVASLIRPVALDALHDIINRALVDICTLINDMEFKEIYINRQIDYLENSIVSGNASPVPPFPLHLQDAPAPRAGLRAPEGVPARSTVDCSNISTGKTVDRPTSSTVN